MLKNSKVALIGSGTMGEAIIQGLLNQGTVAAEQISASARSQERCTYIQKSYGIQTSTCNIETIRAATMIILCVKPQLMDALLLTLAGQIPPETLVISIAAGITVEALRQGLKHDAIVRAMPNTPALVGMWMTVWYASSGVTAMQRSQTTTLLQALGAEIPLTREAELDQATALSGAGPGFTLLVIEAMIDAGVQLGLSRPQAELLTLQTIAGTVELMRQTQRHPADLRNQVTSPGGVTAIGLYELEKGGLRTTLCNAVLAAFQRTQQLSQLSNKAVTSSSQAS